MRRLQAFRFVLRPDGAQARLMRRFAGMARVVYNRSLAEQQARFAAAEKKLSYAGLCREITTWRNSAATPWLADAPVHVLQQSVKDLERAYANFFAKRAAFPKFKKKGRHDALRFPDTKQFTVDSENGRIKLPKLGWMRYRKSRAVLGEIKSVTLSFAGGRWHVSILTERDLAIPVHPFASSLIASDAGIVTFATLSNGEQIEGPRPLQAHLARLAFLQRRVSRKKKGSKNRRKAVARVNKLHARIGAIRSDFLHQTTTRLAKTHGIIVLEDLKIGSMSRSARGTIARPGRRVRQKAGLNRSILDQGWGEFCRQLQYKLEWNGGTLLLVPRGVHQPDVSRVRALRRGEPTHAGCLCLCRMWLHRAG